MLEKLRFFIEKIAVNAFLIPLFFIFSYIIPKNKKLILMGSNLGTRFIGNSKYLYLYLLENNIKDISYYWMTKNKGIYNEFRRLGRPVLRCYSLKGIYNILRANYFVVEQSAQDVSGITFTLGHFNIINLWHGVPIKKILFDNKDDQKGFFSYFMRKEWGQYRYVITKAKDDIAFMKSGFRNDNVACLGYARDDILVRGDKQPISGINLAKYRAVFLYAPTFRDYYSQLTPFSAQFFDKLNACLSQNNSVLLLKMHIADQNAGRDIKLYKNYSNILDITKNVDNLQEILTNIDILITDYSGIAFDFCLLDKPIIFYPYDYENYKNNCREIYYDYFQDMLGPFAKTEDELFSLISTLKIWFNDQNYQERYKKFKDRFNYYQDGLSSKRLYEFIIEHL